MTSADSPDPDTYLWEFRCEDFVFARLDEDQTRAGELLDDAERAAALHRIETLRFLAADHCIFVSRDGDNWCQCITCPQLSGVPCSTIRLLARLWPDHLDYMPGWNEGVERPRVTEHTTPDGTVVTSYGMRMTREVAAAGGYRKLRGWH